MFVVADIGGTQTRIAQADKTGLQSDYVSYPTEQSFSDAIAHLKTEILKLKSEEALQAVIIGVAGSILKDRSGVHNSPHLPDWNHKPLRNELSQALKTPVFLENDATLVGLGEAVFGAGKGNRIVAYITVSTGVGGGRIVDEDIDAYAYGFEPGHQVLMTAPNLLAIRELESFIGGAELEKRLNMKVAEIQDDQILDDIARYTAYGIHNAIMFWSPDVIVMGGGLVMHDVVKLATVEAYLQKINTISPQLPPIVKGELAHIGGLYGGVAYIKKRF